MNRQNATNYLLVSLFDLFLSAASSGDFNQDHCTVHPQKGN